MNKLVSSLKTIFRDRELLVALYVSAGLFVIAVISGKMLYSPELTMGLIESLESSLSSLKDIHPVLLFLFILLNNAIKAFFIILLGVAAGIPAFLFIFVNGFILSLVVAFAVPAQGWYIVLANILPHGILEIPLMILTAALSLLIGWESIKWIRRQPSNAKARMKSSIYVYISIILPGLIIASLIEAFITPMIGQSM